MTHQLDAARGRDLVARWCALAEQRLEHLTELFETGRWRRYHSEVSFLDNIQEAKTAVETWRDLSMREASRDNAAADASWLGRTRATPPRGPMFRGQVHNLQPQPAEILAELPPSDVSLAQFGHVSSEDALRGPDSLSILERASGPELDGASEPALNIDAIEQRYPLLRNAL